ncbi:MAG: Collagen triple helix repeat-containing protein, partial [Bacteroidetes bacterium]|nr:Collagen triple helix repeat-containing protein [Bacteroidota bacterium]
MKKTIRCAVLTAMLCTAGDLLSQLPASGTPPPPVVPLQAAAAWFRGGNNGPNNIFGTTSIFNSPIYTMTGGTFRTWLNGTKNAANQMPINGVTWPTLNTGGYFGIGNSTGASPLNPANWNLANSGPWSLLHLEGPNNTVFGGNGWRQWMQTGTFLKEHSDNMYVGMKSEGSNRSDAMIAWGDDATPGSSDALRFAFINNSSGNGGGVVNPINSAALNGYEIMRMIPFAPIVNSTGSPVGHVGIGPLFNAAVQPQSRLHMNSEEFLSNYMQITSAGATGQTGGDGLKVGLTNVTGSIPQSGNACIYNQENRHLLFSTNNPVPTSAFTTDERMRITSLSAPTENPSGTYVAGGYNPGGLLFSNATRIGVSYLPNLPVTSPLSLLHLGGNTSITNDGWRNWMDIGTFVNIPLTAGVQGGNFYSGMKFAATTASIGAVRDAVINWGFSPSTAASAGNKLRFVFTSNAGGPLISAGANGIEAGHFTSDGNNTRLGIGDFAIGDPGNTCEIKGSASSFNWPPANPGGVSGLRLTHLTSATAPVPNPGQGVLAVNSNGDVIYVKASSSSAGCCIGAACGTPFNPLPSAWNVPLNNFNYYFSGNGA